MCFLAPTLHLNPRYPPKINRQIKVSLSHSQPLSLLPSPQDKSKDKDKRFRPLYDIPYMFEAREFLRKKLIGKKVSDGQRLSITPPPPQTMCLYSRL